MVGKKLLGFTGVVGDESNPANLPRTYVGSFREQYLKPDYLGQTIWSQTLKSGYNVLVDQGILPALPAPIPDFKADYDIEKAAIIYANYMLANSNGGIFSILVPGAVNGFLNADLYTTQAVDNLNDKDTALPPEFRGNLQGVLDSYNNALAKDGLTDFSSIPAPQTLVYGNVSNKSIKLGDYNNIFITSPVMTDYNYTVNQIANSGTSINAKSTSQIFYPTAQGNFQSNTLTAGNGNNIIYYDSSFKSIQTGNGDNFFVPSFGSFNWAVNNLQNPVSNKGSQLIIGNGTKNPNQTLFTPVSLPSSGSYTVDNIYSVVTAFGSYYIDTSGNPPSVRADQSTEPTTYVGAVAYAPNNPLDPKTKAVISELAPHIGGQTFVAGTGNDIFFGADPNFYSSVNGSANRTVWALETSNTNNERFSYQNYTTITMLGGGGNNIFYLGDPTKIAASGLQYFGNYSYKISTAHQFIATESDKAKAGLDFGSHLDGVNNINLDLTSNVNSYTNKSSSFDQDKGKSTGALDNSKLGVGFGSLVVKGLEKLGSYKLPVIDVGLSVVSFGLDLAKTIIGNVAPDPKPITLTTEQISQPLGLWKQAVEINDWNPQTVININVTPSITTAPSLARWNNIKFAISSPGLESVIN